MSDFLTSLVAVVAVLGFMILIHEFGHYAVAKWLGVRWSSSPSDSASG